mmetsp:Transcript_38209/g.68888  ORF Transcript_38209/g.68888 Transcript_38209/m.68888 type:complete len:130 (-) Transcript_38209:99-488(-)|eukprot:CAMPEP_0201867704 /NCGR_PEP_ID=MMETSP0902-20130614/1854_1 /ASSEMBLY_ACC=CAM_ASM_000551 /TAXON_ID=420261 /ORGANISM="Thalassiosira antarctica, Strain CCMP982" /LENGTH=129 /DNA_ID=CAMNT_0048392913 /DNA_START=106 /DNA_END=495 /DNA_ORIENTATION=+
MPFGDPKFTVVNPSPDVDAVLRSLRFSDYLSAVGISGGSWAYGYMLGKPTRMACGSTAMALGMTCASMLVLQNGRSRLRGYRENEKEVIKYGAWPFQPDLKPLGTKRFPIATGTMSETTRPPLNWKNYD